MIYNQIKFAIRNISKDLGYSLINIIGLTIGISTTLFLLIYVFDELSYDKYHNNHEQIYRVSSHITETDDDFIWNVAQIPFAPQVKADYPEVEDAIRFQGTGKRLFEYGERKFYDSEVMYVDSTVFEVFTYPMIVGNTLTSLNEPNCIVLTESFAAKLFGAEDPMGKMIKSEDKTLKVTGVIKDIPLNSHFTFNALISWTTVESRRQSWGNFGLRTYLKLKKGTDIEAFDKKLEELYPKFMASIFEQFGVHIDYILQPISKIHLYPVAEGDEASGDIRFIKIFFLIAIFLLVIAGINYMNLTTARSVKRSREVGIRKVAGAHRSMLVRQFLAESLVLTLIASMLSIGLCYLLLPNFNTISGKELDFSFISKSSFLLSMGSIIVILGILSGLYPAFFLSRFQPINALKGKQTKGSGHGMLRKTLVVLQFAISLSMIISTMVVYEQLDHLKNKDMGFNKDNVVRFVLNTRERIDKLPVLRNELLAVSGVKSIGSTDTRIGRGSAKNLLRVETNEDMVEKGVNLAGVDYEFISTLEIEILEGRSFSKDFQTDTLGLVINESMAKRFNWEEPLGKKIEFGENQTARVIGLMKDYNQTGLYNPVESLVLYLRENGPLVYVKLENAAHKKTTLEGLEQAWTKVFPSLPFEYTYLEENLFEQIEPDEKRGVLFTLFSIVVIIIAILGVFGLASYMVEQRTKEISIRKILGAKPSSVVQLIFKDYLILIGISILIAFPVAYYFMTDFLTNYEYRTSLSIATFALAGIILLGITLLTVSYHTFKITRSNPVDSLRIE